MEHLREEFKQALAAALPGQDIALERPRSGEMGDAAFPCFRSAKSLGVNPAQLAKDLAAKLRIEGAELVAAGRLHRRARCVPRGTAPARRQGINYSGALPRRQRCVEVPNATRVPIASRTSDCTK